MTWYQWLCVLGMPTLTGIIITDIVTRIRAQSKKVTQKKKEQAQENIRSVLKIEVASIVEKLDNMDNMLVLVKEGSLASLRNDLLNCYYDCARKGYRENEDIMNFYDMHEAYEKLGGNSFIEDIRQLFDKIPSEEHYKEKHK